MSDTKYIELVTWNRKMILMHGDKLTPTQKAIGLRSNGLHSEIRFSDRDGRISFSCTLADGCGCCRFINSQHSHPYRQSRVRIPVTAEQEARLFNKACKMADVETNFPFPIRDMIDSGLKNSRFCIFGPNAIKYDEWGARLSFISRKLNWWKMHPERMICNEACAEVLLKVWPDLLVVDQVYHDTRKSIGEIAPQIFIESYNNKNPSDLTPDQLEYLVRHYFEKELS